MSNIKSKGSQPKNQICPFRIQSLYSEVEYVPTPLLWKDRHNIFMIASLANLLVVTNKRAN